MKSCRGLLSSVKHLPSPLAPTNSFGLVTLVLFCIASLPFINIFHLYFQSLAFPWSLLESKLIPFIKA